MHTVFFGCDWGTSSFRLRLLDAASGNILAASASDEGIAALHAAWTKAAQAPEARIGFYSAVISRHITIIEQQTGIPAAHIPLVVTGMASSSIGIMELPYALLPFSLKGEGLQYKLMEETADFPHRLLLISGARTENDVMRGEEVQLLGAATAGSAERQSFIFPGTHSKHVAVADGKAVDIATYMTGEVFALLCRHSILSNSVQAGKPLETAADKASFTQGVRDSLHQNLLHDMFMVRTRHLFERCSPVAGYYYLSGLLAGTELQQLQQQHIEAVTIVGDAAIAIPYQLALEILGIPVPVSTTPAALATIRGQQLVYCLLG